jgi:plastocyanin
VIDLICIERKEAVMKFIASVLTGIILIGGCHPTVYLKPDKGDSNKLSSNSLPAYSTQMDSLYSYDESDPTIYPYIEPLDELTIAQTQGDANQPAGEPQDANEPNTPATDEPQTEPAGSIQIIMTASLTFEPSDVRVSLGQPVVWVNRSEMIHTVTDDPAASQNIDDVALPGGAQPFDSGDIAPGTTYTMTFAIPGTYKYFCKYHELGGMLGQITVMPLNQ